MKTTVLLLMIVLCHVTCATSTEDTTENVTPSTSSPLAKFVLLFSRPGAFARETQAAYGDELSNSEESKCPTGEEGLNCRRMEARRGADECTGGGTCSSCRSCDETRALEWPRCCKKHFLCCSQLANACQQCDHPELAPFCAKRFKKCF